MGDNGSRLRADVPQDGRARAVPVQPRICTEARAPILDGVPGPRVLYHCAETDPRALRAALKRDYTALGEPGAYDHVTDVLRAAFGAGILPADMRLGKDGFARNLYLAITLHALAKEYAIPREFTTATSAHEKALLDELLQTFYWSNELKPYGKDPATEIRKFMEFIDDPAISHRVKMLVIFQFMADAMVARDSVTDTTLPDGHVMFPHYDDWNEAVKAAAYFMLKVLVPFADRYGLTDAYRSMVSIAAEYLYPDTFRTVKGELEMFEQAGVIQRTNKLADEILEEVARLSGMRIRPITSKTADSVSEREIGVVSRHCKSTGTLTAKVERTGIKVREVHDTVARFIILPDTCDVPRLSALIKEVTLAKLAEIGVNDVDIRQHDYLGQNQKPNGYQSMHLDVEIASYLMFLLKFEFIVRTVSMHKNCDLGEANHAEYKNGSMEVSMAQILALDAVAAQIRKRNGWH